MQVCEKDLGDELNLEQIRQSLVNAQTAMEVVEIILKLKKIAMSGDHLVVFLVVGKMQSLRRREAKE